ncbi:MAG TPA: hypothetical protein VGD96_11695 [Bradyrhizobium sp.]|jgi:hypothetical protein
MQRRRFKHTTSFEERLVREAERAKAEAKTLPDGAARDLLLKKARQAETAAHISEWLSSPGLRPPR